MYSWMSNNLRSSIAERGSFIYQESDLIHNVYFLIKGQAGFAIPRSGSYYILVEPGDTFGDVDVAQEILDLILADRLEELD